MGDHTSVVTLWTCVRHLVMVQICSAPQNTLILTAKTALNEIYATLLKTIFFWDTLQARANVGHPNSHCALLIASSRETKNTLLAKSQMSRTKTFHFLENFTMLVVPLYFTRKLIVFDAKSAYYVKKIINCLNEQEILQLFSHILSIIIFWQKSKSMFIYIGNFCP